MTKHTLHKLFFLAILIALIVWIIVLYAKDEPLNPKTNNQLLTEQAACLMTGGKYITYTHFENGTKTITKEICELDRN